MCNIYASTKLFRKNKIYKHKYKKRNLKQSEKIIGGEDL